MQVNRVGVKERIVYLDSARGLAALSVMIWHFLVMFFNRGDERLLKNPLHILYYGEADVIFFFIHSGFILSYSYFDKFKNISFSFFIRFFLERLFRIIPLFLFVLSISFLAYLLLQHSNNSILSQHAVKIWNTQIGTKDFLQQINLFNQSGNQADKRLIPQDWTLTVELIAGLSIPIFLGLMKPGKYVWAIVIFVLSVKFINTFVFEFGCGLSLFFFRSNIVQAYSRLNKFLKLSIIALSLLFYTCFLNFGSLFSADNIIFSYSIDRIIVVIGCLLIFIILITSATIQKLLSQAFLVLVGKICYSLYLWHMLWLILFTGSTYQFFAGYLKMPEGISLAVTFFCFLTSTFCISWLTYLFIEVPFNKLGKRVARVFINKRESLALSIIK